MKFVLFFPFLFFPSLAWSGQIDPTVISSVSYRFNMNENGGAVTANFKSNSHGTLANSPSWVTGLHGPGLNFNNSGARVSMSNVDRPDGDLPMTVFLFILNNRAFKLNRWYFQYGTSAANNYRRIISNNRQIQVDYGAPNSSKNYDVFFPTAAWFGIAVRYDGALETLFYESRTANYESNFASTTFRDSRVVSGLGTTGGGGLFQFGGNSDAADDCQCTMDDFMLVNRAMSDNEIIFHLKTTLAERNRRGNGF